MSNSYRFALILMSTVIISLARLSLGCVEALHCDTLVMNGSYKAEIITMKLKPNFI